MNGNISTEIEIFKLLESLRWGTKVICPHCTSAKTLNYNIAHKFQCENCFRSFSVVSKTAFEFTKLPLSTWLTAYFLISEQKEISPETLNKWLKVTHKTSQTIHIKINKIIESKNDWINNLAKIPHSKKALLTIA